MSTRRLPEIFQVPMFLLLASLWIVPGCLAGEVYKTVGPDGKVTYSDAPPPGATQKIETRAKAPRPEDDPVAAALMVFAQEVVVETASRLCSKEDPESSALVAAARNRWMERHEAIRTRKIAVLHDIRSMDELRKIAKDAERDNETILAKLRQAPQGERIKWCRDAPKKFGSPEMDLTANLTLVNTIMNYKLKR